MQQQQSMRLLGLALVILLTVGCDASVNSSIHVDDGESVSGSLNSVNGSIRIGRDANVSGDSRTVNGSIAVGTGSQVQGLGTVNGGIEVDDTTVDGNVESVNGSVRCNAGTTVTGDISTVNGAIQLYGTAVEGNVETHNGDVILASGTRVARDVVIEKSKGGNWGSGGIEIRVQEGSVIEGNVIARSKRKVKVYLEGGEIKGEVRNAEIVNQRN